MSALGEIMKDSYRVAIIGGGVVGASVLYHLAKNGWTDCAIIERSILAAGSSWHAAGGVHALNADPNMSALQGYTLNLLSQIQEREWTGYWITYDWRYNHCKHTRPMGMVAKCLSDLPNYWN